MQSESEVNRFPVPLICSRLSYPLAPLKLTFWAFDFTMVTHAGHLFCLRHCANCFGSALRGPASLSWRRVEPPDCARICVSSVWQLHMTWVCQWLQNLLPSMLRHMETRCDQPLVGNAGDAVSCHDAVLPAQTGAPLAQQSAELLPLCLGALLSARSAGAASQR